MKQREEGTFCPLIKKDCVEFKCKFWTKLVGKHPLIPGQTVDSGVSGGGTQNYFISESELENSNKIVLEVANFGNPAKIEDLQINYNRIETSNLGVFFE